MTLPPLFLPAAVFVVGIALTTLVAYLAYRRQDTIAARIDQLAGDIPISEPQAGPKQHLTFLPTIRHWLTARAMTERVQRDLDGAGISLSAEEFILIVVVSTLFLGVVGLYLTRNLPTSIILALIGYFGPWRLVRFLRNRRRLRLEVQLADALTLMAASLRAGHTAIQSMEITTQQLPPPIAEEFSRVVFNVNLGVSVSDALDEMARRVQSYEYDMMVSAVTTQLEVGGSITELLDNIAQTIRDRAALRDEMRALTAQGRLSGVLLSAMPVALFAYVFFVNRDYVNILLEDPVGQKILKTAIGMEVIGWLVINRILNVRV